MKKTLSLRLRVPEHPSAPPVSDVEEIERLCVEAIGARVCIAASYNGGAVVLQPLLLYREHEAVFLLAHTVTRDGKPPREVKVGNFRLSGLTNVVRTATPMDRTAAAPDDWSAGRATRELVARIEQRPALRRRAD